MPLKFLKKCRQYNVTSKSLFVISVHHLLDTTTTVDCTISSESKGQECLDNVCQRLLIQQPEFFGLRYIVKGKEDEMKWIDLERSLSRQLEKYAAGTKIFLRVRHYVTTGVRHLSDEVTRYYYFLQLKNDIYEGKIPCDIRTAILLALYCRQAEYDSYQIDKQSKDYLKKSLVLPKNLQGLANDDNLLDSLILEVLQQHAGIQRLSTTQAEEMYIQCCQQLESYGEERFQARDNLGNDLILGLAINGMVVTAENGRQYFPWKDFHTVTIDKRTIRIEQHKTDGTLFVGSFIFSEADMARYFWKLCITQHKFFKRYIDEDSPSVGDVESNNGITIDSSGGVGSGILTTTDTFSGYDLSDSREDLLLEQRAIYTPGSSTATVSIGGNPYHASQTQDYIAAATTTTTNHHHLSNMQSINLHGSALMSSNISLATSHQSGGGNGGGGAALGHNINDNNSTANGSVLHVSHLSRNNAVSATNAQKWLNKDYPQEYISSQHLAGSILDNRLQSSSCQDLSNNNNNPLSNSHTFLSHNNNNNNHAINTDAHERERLKAMLPTYRPAPDYETAVQLKYQSPSNELHNLNQLQYQAAALAAHNNAAAAYYAGSQPDVHQAAGVYSEGLLLGHLPTHRYPDVAQPAAALHAHHHLNAAAAVAAAASGVNLSSGNNVYVDLSQHLHMIRSRPRLSSSSTPDLAMASHRPLLGYRAYVSGSSPDLVSNRNILNSQCSYVNGVNSIIGSIGAGGSTASGVAAGLNITTSSGATMLHQYPYVGHHSQTFLPPHGTFDNLNIIEEQPSIMLQLRQAAAAAATVRQNCETSNSPTMSSPTAYRGSSVATSQTIAQQQQQQQQPAVLQHNAINGSIEPIYENVPLPQYNNNNNNSNSNNSKGNSGLMGRNIEQRSSGSSVQNVEASMRNRTSSIQSAPGGMNGQNMKYQSGSQQPTPNQQHITIDKPRIVTTRASTTAETTVSISAASDVSDEISMNIKKFSHQNQNMKSERTASIEVELKEPIPAHRNIRASPAAPTVASSENITHEQQAPLKMTPPPRHYKGNVVKTKTNSSDMLIDDIQTVPPKTSVTSSCTSIRNVFTPNSNKHIADNSLAQHFSTINLSTSHTITNTTNPTTSSIYNNSTDISTTVYNNSNNNSSNSNFSPSTTGKSEKQRKKRWHFLGRSKTPDKQKSATLGREKANNINSKLQKIKFAQDDLNLHHRWSTGMPKLQPISGQFTKEKLSQVLIDKLNDPQLFMEFEAIPKRRELARYDCALMLENTHKNSDPNFLPYDDNRVRLIPTMENRHGYVNASHISATVGSKQRFYIVAQSPHDELTTRIFWQCVWEADVYLIVQLSDDINYIPPTTHNRMEFGQFQLYQEFSQTTDRCITSKLRLYHMQSRRYRSVWHLNYFDWAEQNCPSDINHFLDFLEELNSVRMASINEVPPGHNTNPPVLLHCLEGGGRSGVTLTADLLLYTLDHNEDLDIPRVIGQLRHQRDSIIPSLAQYKIIYHILVNYLKRTRLI